MSAAMSLIGFRTSLAKASVSTLSVARFSPCMILPTFTSRPMASDSKSASNVTSSLCSLASLLANSNR